jgi:phage baseplate assembly protein W
MAVRLGNKVVIDTEEYNDYAVGITLPIQIGNTAFNQSFTTKEQVESNLKNLLFTKKGERIMQPEFGCGLQELLFQPNDSDLEEQIEDTINEAVSFWLPYIRINAIDIQSDPAQRDVNRINVKVTYTYGDDITLNQITFTI